MNRLIVTVRTALLTAVALLAVGVTSAAVAVHDGRTPTQNTAAADIRWDQVIPPAGGTR
ncbi:MULTISPECIES: hypothetical protein [Kitasatospora]|uniref:Uncharacterized protein n=1 Tax=Kitasatospora cystarginea TaxID=58350 RepID=A0ABN3DKC5_9ACTN